MDLKKIKKHFVLFDGNGGFMVLIYWIITKENYWRGERT
jgi:hypothetical protein